MTGFIPSGSTRLFSVVGDPIDQVRSPSVLTRLLVDQGEEAVVVPMHVAAADLPTLFQALHTVRNIGGILVTVPHKQEAFRLCATATDRAAFVEAANVVRRLDDGWHGDNTDGLGYLDGIERQGFAVAGRKCLLIGCGGAGAAIALEIMRRGASLLAIHDIDRERRDAVIAKLDRYYRGRLVVGSADPAGYDLVANATPLGMRPEDPLPIDVSKLESRQFVACVVTKPEVPPLIEEARRRGCRTMTGAGMFDAQAATLVDFLLTRPSEREVGLKRD
ncbi:shikimate dehydrogenase family protein [Rhizobium lentis]|uniref:Shikimate dehydrogenase n=1 Tax=Rhizobium lentis TaxID=1138194 RepID=A0A9Q3QV85_9HYPH|nr:shikimate dehydrogenase [Rhizobium lentis]MBX5009289.1 shikimate dehydrogenase [Rhizobium lentis]MBX5021694.1 shikimate dehydrogenase [Rhizobium lentis]MBX5045650.1 shikimate dehydrogenase [Rhizobium lentis]MBX5057662.1 shikimate dehydrogenase [Rhizobium lentis]MBX5063847.1 shikimate dehydrogenase [Rhizobium lentis]